MEILTLGSKIKYRRREMGLTLKDLAGDRVTPAQLSYVETDKCKPSLDLLEYIAEKLGLEMDYLLESEKKQVSRFCEYSIKLSQIDILKRNFDEAVNRIEQVKYAAHSYGLDFFTGECEKFLGEICAGRADYVNANKHFYNALQNFSKINNLKKIAEIYILLGIISYKRKYLSCAFSYLVQAETFIDKMEDIEIIARLETYFYLVKVCKDMNDKLNLFKYADKLYDYIKFTTDISQFAEKFLEAGRRLEQAQRYNEALEYVSRSLFIFEGIYNMQLISKVETELGSTFSESDYDNSLKHLKKALEIAKISGDKSIPATILEIAHTHIRKKDYDNALHAINEALNFSINAGDRYHESLAYFKLFKTFSQKGDYIKAEESVRRCADILETIDMTNELASCYLDMGQFYRFINREKEAIEYISKSIELYQNCNISSR